MDKIKYFKQKDVTGNTNPDFKQVIKGVIWSTTASVLLLIITAIVLTYTNVSISFVKLFSNVIFYIGAMLSGIISSIKIKSNGWLHGIIAGGVYAFLLFFVGFCVNVSGVRIKSLLVKFLLSLFFGGTGGIVGVNVRVSKKR